MTSTTEYHQGRQVYVIDKENDLYGSELKIIVVRQCKKGFLCAVEDGTQRIFKQSEIEVYPDYD